MTLLEFLAEVRRPYAQLLSTAIAGNAVFAEPALRTENGELAVDGLWSLPIRPDFIPRNGDGKSGMVDSKSRLDFEPFVVSYGDCKVELAPFTWDWLSLTVDGLRENCSEDLFRSWFLRWFDPEDTNEIGDDGLAGAGDRIGPIGLVDEAFGAAVLVDDVGAHGPSLSARRRRRRPQPAGRAGRGRRGAGGRGRAHRSGF